MAAHEYPVCYLTPNNFAHKAGDGKITRKRNISYLHPALQASPGDTQATYLLVEVLNEQSDRGNRFSKS